MRMMSNYYYNVVHWLFGKIHKMRHTSMYKLYERYRRNKKPFSWFRPSMPVYECIIYDFFFSISFEQISMWWAFEVNKTFSNFNDGTTDSVCRSYENQYIHRIIAYGMLTVYTSLSMEQSKNRWRFEHTNTHWNMNLTVYILALVFYCSLCLSPCVIRSDCCKCIRFADKIAHWIILKHLWHTLIHTHICYIYMYGRAAVHQYNPFFCCEKDNWIAATASSYVDRMNRKRNKLEKILYTLSVSCYKAHSSSVYIIHKM